MRKWKILYLRRLLKSRQGYSLIEAIISIFFIGIIILSVVSFLNFSIVTSNESDYKDEILSNGRYGLEYVIGEIKKADKIIDSRLIEDFNFKRPSNLGFVIYNHYENKEHEYTSYYIDGDVLYRIKCRKTDAKYPDGIYFINDGGVNFLSEYIWEDKTSIDFQNNIINLSFLVGNEDYSYDFTTSIYLDCPIDY